MHGVPYCNKYKPSVIIVKARDCEKNMLEVLITEFLAIICGFTSFRHARGVNKSWIPCLDVAIWFTGHKQPTGDALALIYVVNSSYT